MSVHITSGDLDEWSRRRDSEGHLPTLVRRLIMETVRPDWIRMPAAEGVALSGLDGIVSISGSSHPYLPDGDSVWEIGTEQGQRAKAIRDYEKRTKDTPIEVRRTTTYIAVTNRKWSKGDKWVKDMKDRGEWKEIIVLTADELTNWLDECPNAEGWLREHLRRGSLGDTALDTWFERWSKQTMPATPDAVLTAGRREDVISLLETLDAPVKDAITIAASTLEEAIAFTAAALRLGPEPLTKDTTGEPDDEPGPAPDPDPDIRQPEHLEALRERSVVINDEDGWRRWGAHHTPHVLIPTFMPASVSEALEAGHHVILPKTARTAHETGRLQPIDPHSASTAWRATGIDFSKAHEYALATRRNLRSLRRRLSRYGHQTPTWSTGSDAPLLASALLAGAWDASKEGDREVLLALTRAADWPDFTKTVTRLAAGEDPPLDAVGNHWDFVDIVDAWDAISHLITPDDIKTFTGVITDALTEIDPDANLTLQERLLRSLNDDRPKRRYSNALQRGLSTTLAMLGAHAGDHPIAGGRTGQELATTIVRDLLEHADEVRWLTLSGQLQLLAEAAPDAFLHALETSLRAEKPTVMAMFLEKSDSLNTFSAHSSLLWALETLAFSPAHVARVAIILARMAVLDPGGKLSNRPAASLASALDPIRPDGAINAANRMDILDAVITTVPEHAISLLQTLVENRGGVIPSGPRYRDWPTDRYQATSVEYQDSLTGTCTRLLNQPGTDGLTTAARLVSRFSSADLVRVLDALAARWDELDENHRGQVLDELAKDADHHRRYSNTAWAMQEDDLAAITKFLEANGFDLTAGEGEALFSWKSDLDEYRDKADPENPQKPVAEQRVEVIESVLEGGGLDAVVELASKVEVPGYVGLALAVHDLDTNELTDEVLDLLGDGSDGSGAAAIVAWGYASRRAEDFAWLNDNVAKRPNQGAVLLRTVQTTAAVLDLVANLDDDQQALFWKGVNPYRIDNAIIEHVCEGLLAAGRPFSAMAAAAVHGELSLSADLIMKVLTADLENINEAEPTDYHQLSHTVGMLLNRLEKLGTDDETLAYLEFYYLPVLEHERKPRALHRELARKPEQFVTAVTSVYKPDTEPDTDVKAAVAGTETSGMTDEESRFSSAAWSLLHGWHGPLPGTTEPGKTPTTEAMQAWVDQVRALLTEANRAQLASTVIGEALAAPVVDDGDGIWPCQAVRNVIEKEQSDDLETGLLINRLNQRGGHGRAIYAGGQRERTLADKYLEDAEKVRNRWPRTGKLLEDLAKSYMADARREDETAEHDARRHR
jgi:hypothetical protein